MTLICLVSGQLAPNLLSVLHFKPDEVVLVCTSDSRDLAERFKDLLISNWYFEISRSLNRSARSLLSEVQTKTTSSGLKCRTDRRFGASWPETRQMSVMVALLEYLKAKYQLCR